MNLSRRSLAAIALASLAGFAFAQDKYPSKPIRLIVPYPPGASTDILARSLGQKLSTNMGVPVVVDNKAGASGIIGTAALAKAEPDGYTIGIAVPSTEVRIVGDDGRDVEAGEPGELVVRGPQVMLGYWNNAEETARVLSPDGWLHTGDVAVVTPEGYLKIVDRKKDMVVVSGFNVYPNEIEEVVVAHPDVLECAVVGIPDERTGEALRVFVVPRHPGLTVEALRDFCRENLTGYKMPREFVIRTELPKSNVGKILRRELRDQ